MSTKIVHLALDPLNPQSWTVHSVEDLCAFLKEQFGEQFPDTAKIYFESVSMDSDVTPHETADIEKLQQMEGTFFVVVYPGWAALPYIFAFVLAAASFILAPSPALSLPTVAQRNQQTSSPNNELSERQNRPRINGRIPDIFGTVRSTPDLIAAPYKIFENNREVEYAYMCIGRGFYDVADVRDGQTLVTNIPGSGVVVYEPFTSPNNTAIPQATFGTYFRSPIYKAKRSNSVNGQVLRPPNTQTFVANGNVRFRYPNIVEMQIYNSEDFTKYFVEGDEISITGATMTASTSVGEVIECKVTNRELRYIYFYGRLRLPATYGRHQGLVFSVDQEETVRAFFTVGTEIILTQTAGGVDLSGTYTVSAIGIVEARNTPRAPEVPDPTPTGTLVSTLTTSVPKLFFVDFVNPATVNSNWNTVVPPAGGPSDLTGWSYYNYLPDYVFGAALDATESYDLDLDATYTVISVTQWEITLDNPVAVNSDWSVINANGGTTPYLSPSIAGIGERWIGPFVITEDDTQFLFANFVASNGLYKDNGVDQTAVEVSVQLEVTPIDETDEAVGASSIFNMKLIGSSTLKETISQTLKAALSSFIGRLKVRARRTTETDEAFEGTVVDEVRWRDVYSMATVDSAHFGNVTTLQTVTFATASALAVKERRLNLLASRRIPVKLTDTSFDDINLLATSRADAIFCAICRDRFIGNRELLELDIANIYSTIAAVQTYFGDTACTLFNYTFDNDNLSFEETANIVANAVFCIAYRRGSVIRLSLEKRTDNSILLFNHRNKIPDSEKRTISFGKLDDNDGIEYTYVAPEDDSIISVFLPEAYSAINPKRIESVGVRNHLQAYFQSWRAWNKIQFQSTTIEFDGTHEANILLKNDRILVADSTRVGTQDGEVIAVVSLELTLSQKVDLTVYPAYSIFFQHTDGTVESKVITAGSAANKVVLASAPAHTLNVDPETSSRATYVIVGSTEKHETAFLVTDKTPTEGLVATVRGINYDERYYANDPDFINGGIGSNGYGPFGGWTGAGAGGEYTTPSLPPEGIFETVTWGLGIPDDFGYNGDPDEPPPMFAAWFPGVGATYSGYSGTINSSASSPRTVTYSPTYNIDDDGEVVIIYTFSAITEGGDVAPTITFGGLAMTVHHEYLPPATFGSPASVIVFAYVRVTVDGLTNFVVTWPSGNGHQIRGRAFVGFNMDDVVATYVSAVGIIPPATGICSVELEIGPDGLVVSGCFDPVPSTLVAPTGYDASSADLIGDNQWKIARLAFAS